MSKAFGLIMASFLVKALGHDVSVAFFAKITYDEGLYEIYLIT